MAVEVGLLRSSFAHAVRAGIYPVAMAALAFAAAFALNTVALVTLPIAIIIGIFIAMSRFARVRPVLAGGLLSVRGGYVTVGARAILARDRITSGVVMPGNEGTFVRLEQRAGTSIDLKVDDVEKGREALTALGLDPAHAVARFHVLATSQLAWKRRAWWALASVLPILLGIPIAMMLHNPALIALAAPLVVAMALSTIVPARVTVGSDGISARRFGREEFIPLERVVDAIAVDGDPVFNATTAVVQLLDENGAVVRELVVDQKKEGPFTEAIHAAVDARARALAERIREVIALRRRAGDAFDRRTLARGDRETSAWVSELRTLLRRARGFRDAEPPTPEALLAIVEDASAQPIDRVAAAIALAPSGPDHRQRVRIAADATAAPALRIALEAAIDHDEQKLAGALDEIERAREA